MGYEIDGNDLKSVYGIRIEQVRGIYDMLARKDVTEYVWDDKDGSQPFTDADDIRFKARDITLKCYMVADSQATFLQYKDNFENMLKSTGMHTFKHRDLDDIYYVYFRDNAIVVPPKWNANKMVGRFTIKLREPYPVTVQFTTDQSTPATLGFKFSAGNSSILVYWGDGSSSEAAAGVETTFSHLYTVAGTYRVVIMKNLHALTFFEFSLDQMTISGDIRTVGKLNSLKELEIYGTAVTGNIASLKHMSTLTHFKTYTALLVTGNLSSLANLTNLEFIAIGRTAIVGALSSLTKLTSLTTFSTDFANISMAITGLMSSLPTSLTILDLTYTQITGALSTANGLTSLIKLILTHTAVTGALAQITALTSLTELDLEDTAITGDIKDITNNATSIVTFNCKDTALSSYTGTVMPSTIKAFDINGCAVTSVAQISDILEDMAAAPVTSAIIDLAGGTNAIPDGGGLTAKATLEAAGCTVTVNS